MTKPNFNLDQIVADLIEIDPTLPKDQAKIIVEKLLQDKPEVIMDEKFRLDLFARLEDEIKRIKRIEPQTINYSFMKKLNFVLAGTAMVAIAALIYVSMPKGGIISLSGTEEVTKVSANAFGSLAELSVTSSRNQSGGGGGGSGLGGGGAPTMESDKIASPLMPPGSGGGSGIDPSFVPTYYKYFYKGEVFTVEPQLPVYQRVKGVSGSAGLSSFLQNFDVGLFNINKFASSQLDYIRASENKEYGYAINVDMKEGNVTIDQNWERWQNAYPQCQDEACYQKARIKPEDIPSDAEAIAIADSFLDEYGINRSTFGEPYVQNFWRIEYARAADKSMIYLPDVVTVVYPLKIEGNEIYDEGGNKTGLYVSVNARVDKVSNVGPITNLRYQGSDYALEQDTAKLISLAQRGGMYGYMPLPENMEPNAVTKTLELGTPQKAYTRTWRNVKNQNQELYVPSLIFPIINAPEDIYQKSIVIPLVKDILDLPQFGGGGPINIMK